MKVFILLFICTTIYAYKDISENEHFEKILAMPDELRKQLYCYLDKGPCSELASHHKSHIAEGIHDGCAQCTPAHKHNVRYFVNMARNTYPELYMEFREKYDPDGKYFDHLLDEIAEF